MSTTAPGSSAAVSLFANAIGRLWALLANVLMFPIYLRLLGPESFGIVALLATVTAIVALFDFGLTPVLARELNNQRRSARSRGDLLFTAELALGAVLLAFAAGVLALPDTWLLRMVGDGITASGDDVAQALRLVFLIAAAQLLFGLYVAALSGIEAQVRSNLLAVGFGLLRSVGGLLPLLWQPDVAGFLWWQLGATLIGVVVGRAMCRRRLAGGDSRFVAAEIRANLGSAGAAFLLAMAATLNMNLDRLLVGKLLGLQALGEYTIAATLAQLVYLAVVPITLTATPRMVRLLTGGDRRGFERLLRLTDAAIWAAVALLAVVFLRHSAALVQAWSGGAVAADRVAPFLGWLVLGFAALSISAIYHCVAVAHKDFSFGRWYIYSVLLVLPLYAWAVSADGLRGAAIAWAGVQAAIMAGYVVWVRTRLLQHWRRGLRQWIAPLVAAGWATALCVLSAAAGLEQAGFGGLSLLVCGQLALAAALTHLTLRAMARRSGCDDALSEAVQGWLDGAMRPRRSA